MENPFKKIFIKPKIGTPDMARREFLHLNAKDKEESTAADEKPPVNLGAEAMTRREFLNLPERDLTDSTISNAEGKESASPVRTANDGDQPMSRRDFLNGKF
jgi:hypothetical protein